MAQSRIDLHTALVECLGSERVYFQPPASIKMEYPAIVYKRDRLDSRFADNLAYSDKMQYTITLIDRDPESPIFDAVSNLPFTKHDRTFVADDLNHDVFITHI